MATAFHCIGWVHKAWFRHRYLNPHKCQGCISCLLCLSAIPIGISNTWNFGQMLRRWAGCTLWSKVSVISITVTSIYGLAIWVICFLWNQKVFKQPCLQYGFFYEITFIEDISPCPHLFLCVQNLIVKL